MSPDTLISIFRRVVALASLLCFASGTRLLSSALSSETVTHGGILQEQREFDYFMFVRQWPGSFCSTHSCPLVTNRGRCILRKLAGTYPQGVRYHFTIHGLWPNYNDGTWPQFCDKDYDFDEDKIDDLLDELDGEWPSVFDSDATFWEHEWSKHGTCALNIFPSEHSYFQHILRLHLRYDLSAALRKVDIVPSKTAVYRSKDIVDAIRDMYGVRPLVHCTGKQLSEIWMCFDKQLRPFSCDTSHERNNCIEVIIPPFKEVGLEEKEEVETTADVIVEANEQQE